jgi:hypothetical protein
VVTGAGWALGAGALLEVDGNLLRPAQKCSLYYGRTIRLSEVAVLTSDTYAENGERKMEAGAK